MMWIQRQGGPWNWQSLWLVAYGEYATEKCHRRFKEESEDMQDDPRSGQSTNLGTLRWKTRCDFQDCLRQWHNCHTKCTASQGDHFEREAAASAQVANFAFKGTFRELNVAPRTYRACQGQILRNNTSIAATMRTSNLTLNQRSPLGLGIIFNSYTKYKSYKKMVVCLQISTAFRTSGRIAKSTILSRYVDNPWFIKRRGVWIGYWIYWTCR
jgi:hypothetical protein